MARFTSSAELNIDWRGTGYQFVGPAGTEFHVNADFLDSFNATVATLIPGLVWVSLNDLDGAMPVAGGSFDGPVHTRGPVFDVRAYGAKGDGVTDDLAAFNTATAALAAAGGGVILVPAGSYKLSDTWTLDLESVHVELDAKADVFTDGATTDGATIAFVGGGYALGNDTTPQKTWASIRGGTVRNVNNGTADNAIGFVRYKNARAENVRIPTCGRKALTAQYGVDHVEFIGCTIGTTGSDAITVETACNFAVIERNAVASAGAQGIAIPGTVTDLHIRNNVISDAVANAISINAARVWIRDNTILSAGEAGIYSAAGSEFVITGNLISLSQYQGIALVATSGRVEITENYIDRASSAGAGTYDAIYLESLTGRPLIARNRIAGSHRACLNCVSMSGYQALSTGNIMAAGVSAIFSGWVPVLVDDLIDGVRTVGAAGTFHKETEGTAAPTTGTWARGDRCWNTTPSSGGAPGWVCVTAGTSGTWKAMANLA